MAGQPSRTRSALLTRLHGLPSDELFTIPATRTASAFVKAYTAANIETISARRATTTTNPTHCNPHDPPRHARSCLRTQTRSRNEKDVATAKPRGEPNMPQRALGLTVRI